MTTNILNGTVERTAGFTEPTGVARCEELESQSEPYLVSGVAIGENEVTLGANGPKFWPEAELREGAQSLVGVPLTKNHDDKSVESVVGEVIDAGYEPGEGIVFEAEVDNEELATKIARGRLEVSVHALHKDGGRTGEGELIVEDPLFLDLSLVPRGGSPSNFIEAGNSSSEVLASLSEDKVSAILSAYGFGSDDTDSDSNTMTDDTDELEEELEADASESEDELEAEVEADEAEASAETEDGETDATQEATVEADESGADPDLLESELREEVESLRAENQEIRKELQSVRLEYAEQLSEGSPFEAAELAEKFSFDELREKFDEAEASLVTDEDRSETTATPAPQTGDAESELSTGDESDESEVAALESKIENYDNLGWDAAKLEAEQRLEEIRA